MRILVMLSHNPKDSYLVKLHTEELVREIKKLLAKRDNSKAMVTALTKGKIEASGDIDNVYSAHTSLILARDRVSWDLAGKRK